MATRKPVEWTVEEARRHLHALLGEAREAGPQSGEGNHSNDAIIVPLPTWEDRPAASGHGLVEFFQSSGLGDSNLELVRQPDTVEDWNQWLRRRGTLDDLECLGNDLVTRDEESS